MATKKTKPRLRSRAPVARMAAAAVVPAIATSLSFFTGDKKDEKSEKTGLTVSAELYAGDCGKGGCGDKDKKSA